MYAAELFGSLHKHAKRAQFVRIGECVSECVGVFVSECYFTVYSHVEYFIT